MKNRKLVPFERNRYYTGKMLTSADFKLEQDYMNNKRRFVNTVMFGCGIARGLKVTGLDSTTIKVGKGVAVDGTGREIAVMDDSIRKLSSINGFEDTVSDNVFLYLEYSEKEIQPVYAASAGKNENEFNRIIEGYELFLSDDKPDQLTEGQALLTETVLAETDFFKLSFVMPDSVCAGMKIRADFLIRCSDTAACNGIEVEYNANVQFPSFLSDNNRHDEQIEIKQTLHKGESYRKTIWLYVPDVKEGASEIIIKSSLAQCLEDKKNIKSEDVIQKLRIYRTSPRRLVNGIIARNSGEMHAQDRVCIAAIRIKRKEKSCEIIAINNTGCCIELPSDNYKRELLLDYYREYDKNEKTVERSEYTGADVAEAERARSFDMTTGIAEIVVGGRLKKGEVRFSDEIAHGMGLGNVYISLGKIVSGSSQKYETIVIGEQGIFDDDSDNVECAVKLINGKGSFVIGIRAKKDIECFIYKIRWYATDFTCEVKNSQIPLTADKRIVVETPSLVVAPGEQCFFNVHYNNMEPCKLGYELTQRGTGYISEEGVYTAPDREGVYEIRIYSVNDPAISTYAYAIVKRKE